MQLLKPLSNYSSGIGRSGVFVVLDRLLQTIKEHDTLDVSAVVKELWVHRPYIIQSVVRALHSYIKHAVKCYVCVSKNAG